MGAKEIVEKENMILQLKKDLQDIEDTIRVFLEEDTKNSGFGNIYMTPRIKYRIKGQLISILKEERDTMERLMGELKNEKA